MPRSAKTTPGYRPPSVIKNKRSAESYERLKQSVMSRQRARIIAGNDIGEIPPIVDPARRQRSTRSFRVFCESYFPNVFHLNWSPDHLRVIEKIERTVLYSELFAVAMPRGSGKSSLCRAAIHWANLLGHHQYIMVVAATSNLAKAILADIKTELQTNPLLAEDFPEATHPIRLLEGDARGQLAQRYHGERTGMHWGTDRIVMPRIGRSPFSGTVIDARGITSSIRGASVTRFDGRTVRPSLVVADDPQTDKSARSHMQITTRLNAINSTILGLAGPGSSVGVIVPCTVIEEKDLADQLLDQEKNPQWRGERSPMVYAFPTNMGMWDRYFDIRRSGIRSGDSGAAGNAFYSENRDEMDAGSVVAWNERFDANRGEVSAIQHAMNQLSDRGETAFHAECQNQPVKAIADDERIMTVDEITAKLSKVPRAVAHIKANHLTAYVDVQQEVLFWLVAGWSDDFTGWVIDYGTWPDQKRRYFSLKDLTARLSDSYPGGVEGQLHAGVTACTDHLMSRVFMREDKVEMKISRCLVDSRFKGSVIVDACKRSDHAGSLMPSYGHSIRARSTPFEEYRQRPGERLGFHWLVRQTKKAASRACMIDTNFWKTFTHARLQTPIGDRGSLSLFGGDANAHRLIAEHCTAEGRVRTEGRGRIVDEWICAPGRDNHWFDCLVGSAVAASVLGVSLEGSGAPVKSVRGPKKRISIAELRERRNHR